MREMVIELSDGVTETPKNDRIATKQTNKTYSPERII